MNAEKNRFDMAEDFRHIMQAAITLRVLDATEVYLYGANGLTEAEILEDIITVAYACRHSHGDAHGELARMVDAYRAARRAA